MNFHHDMVKKRCKVVYTWGKVVMRNKFTAEAQRLQKNQSSSDSL